MDVLPKEIKEYLDRLAPGVLVRPVYGPDGSQARTWLVEMAFPGGLDDLEDICSRHQATILFL